MCLLEDDTMMLSAALIDASIPLLFALGETTTSLAFHAEATWIRGRAAWIFGSPQTLARRISRRTPSSTAAPQLDPFRAYSAQQRQISLYFQTFAEMQERARRFNAMLQGEPLSSAGQTGASTQWGNQRRRNDPDGANVSERGSALEGPPLQSIRTPRRRRMRHVG